MLTSQNKYVYPIRFFKQICKCIKSRALFITIETKIYTIFNICSIYLINVFIYYRILLQLLLLYRYYRAQHIRSRPLSLSGDLLRFAKVTHLPASYNGHTIIINRLGLPTLPFIIYSLLQRRVQVVRRSRHVRQYRFVFRLYALIIILVLFLIIIFFILISFRVKYVEYFDFCAIQLFRRSDCPTTSKYMDFLQSFGSLEFCFF